VSSHGRIDEYLDGVLADAAMDEFLTHLADCPACQAELHAAIQLRDREDALRAEVGAPPAALDVADAAVEDAPVEEAGGGGRDPPSGPRRWCRWRRGAGAWSRSSSPGRPWPRRRPW
jgi:anti-sigma factor RsiW